MDARGTETRPKSGTRLQLEMTVFPGGCCRVFDQSSKTLCVMFNHNVTFSNIKTK